MNLNASMRSLAERIQGELRPVGLGFALFLRPAPEVAGDPLLVLYMSTADRGDMLRTVDDWLERAQATPRQVNVPSDDDAERLEVERICAALGRSLHREESGVELVLFVFDYGDHGHLAWFSTVKRDETIRILNAWRGRTRALS
jgi:hypothetical protein